MPKTTLEVGELTLLVPDGRSRYNGTRIKLRCDALAYDASKAVMMVSASGSESSVKAFAAALRSDRRLTVDVKWSDRDVSGLYQNREGYKVYRNRLIPSLGIWQIVAVTKAPEFLPVVSEATVYELLRSDQFTTPIVREWMPYLMTKFRQHKYLRMHAGFGCSAGEFVGSTEDLDKIVSEGVAGGHLPIGGRTGRLSARSQLRKVVKSLDDYFLRYGWLLGKQAEMSLDPLHVPGQDSLIQCPLIRQLYPAQAHVVSAGVKALQRQDALMIAAECGTGKSSLGSAIFHTYANGKKYRALVFAPGHLCGFAGKWQREIEETIPGAIVRCIGSWEEVVALDRNEPRLGAEWWIIGRDKAKLGAAWRPSYNTLEHEPGMIRCPGCGGILVDNDLGPMKPDALDRRHRKCEKVLRVEAYVPVVRDGKTKIEPKYAPGDGCGEQLWQMTGEVWRYAPARYIKRRLKGFFDYLVLDEFHEEKSDASAQANAAGSLVSACKKVVALSGTMAGGYAWHLKHLLFRMAPRSLVQEGFTWKGSTAFNERYGRIETVITEKSDHGTSNRQSHGSSSKKSTKYVRPGIMPGLFGKHLIDKSVYLSLDEVADGLPELHEDCIAVAPDEEMGREYRRIEDELKAVLRQMVARGDRRLLGAFLQTLLAYPDNPFGWSQVGYWENGTFIPVVEPKNLDPSIIRPKERALIDLCLAEHAAGRQVWVYCQYTQTYDVQVRVEKLLRNAGLKVGSLRSSCPVDRREEWIAKHGPDVHVCVSHPVLVETGLDLFDKGGAHNFSTLVFFETGYSLFNLRQASRRSWRIGQTLPCKVVYLFYAGTMQERAMALMGKKLAASEALEGKFSSEGLIALSGEDTGSVEVQLAKSLSERMDPAAIRRQWSRVCSAPAVVLPISPPEPEEVVADSDEPSPFGPVQRELFA